jgi:hypothetical protein
MTRTYTVLGHASNGADVRGAAIAQYGLRLDIDNLDLPRGQACELRFRTIENGLRLAVRDFDVERAERMHLILVRPDLSGFQHLHPKMERDGTWAARLELPHAGSYRLFADFARDGRPVTLAGDLRVVGSLPAVAAFVNREGLGVEGIVDGHGAQVGRPSLMADWVCGSQPSSTVCAATPRRRVARWYSSAGTARSAGSSSSPTRSSRPRPRPSPHSRGWGYGRCWSQATTRARLTRWPQTWASPM